MKCLDPTVYVVDREDDPVVRHLVAADKRTPLGRVEMRHALQMDVAGWRAHCLILSVRSLEGFVIEEYVGDNRGLAQACHDVACPCGIEL